jgi:hypothetical protein
LGFAFAISIDGKMGVPHSGHLGMVLSSECSVLSCVRRS